MYLKLSVAGHLTIFLTRTRGPFWSIRPARILWIAVLGTQTLATLIAVYGLFMTPLGWGWAAVRLGLCSGLVPGERPRETARLSDFRPRTSLHCCPRTRSTLHRRSPHEPMSSTRSESTAKARRIKTG